MKNIISIKHNKLEDSSNIMNIHKYIVESTEKLKPRVSYISAASYDSFKEIEEFYKIYSEILGCSIIPITLTNKEYDFEELENIIYNSDILFLGDGDILLLYNYLISNGMDIILKNAYLKGIKIVGIGAGSSILYKNILIKNRSSAPIKINGLNFLDICINNLDSEDLKDDLLKLIIRQNLRCLHLRNESALEWINNKINKIISSSKKKSYMIERDTNNNIQYTELI